MNQKPITVDLSPAASAETRELSLTLRPGRTQPNDE